MNALRKKDIDTIPSKWEFAPLEAICEPPQYGYTASAQKSGNAHLLRITDITDSGVSWASVPFCDCPTDVFEKYRLASGDIVFARIGATTGKSFLIKNPPLSVFASYLIRVRSKPTVDPGFLSCFFRSDDYWRQVNAQKNANLKKGVSGSLLKTLLVPVPPLVEQRKIAAVLGLVQRAIEQQERLIALTAELKKALLHKLFTEGLRGEPQKQTEIGPVPESWEVVELINAVEQIDYGISAPIPKTPPENGVKIVSTADITKDGRLLYEKIRRIEAPEKTVRRLTLQTGDVLFNWRNSAELIGKSAVFQGQIEPHVFASFILRIKCGEKKSHNFFLAQLMNHFRQTSVFLKLARRAVNQANYNRNEISVLKIPLPTYQEQREIADAITAVDAKISNHREKQSKLEELFRTLLHQLMTAQIRIQDPDLDKILGDANTEAA